jgi:hypothetical protein
MDHLVECLQLTTKLISLGADAFRLEWWIDGDPLLEEQTRILKILKSQINDTQELLEKLKGA